MVYVVPSYWACFGLYPLSCMWKTNLIYSVCEVHVYIEKNVLGYVITLPLINRGTFKAYRMIPIPIALGNGKFAQETCKQATSRPCLFFA
jgi:hypothetical protein